MQGGVAGPVGRHGWRDKRHPSSLGTIRTVEPLILPASEISNPLLTLVSADPPCLRKISLRKFQVSDSCQFQHVPRILIPESHCQKI